jgi:hypothetical protein
MEGEALASMNCKMVHGVLMSVCHVRARARARFGHVA